MSSNVFLFAPNLIGYLRILLGMVAFGLFKDKPVLFTVLYCSSALLDAVDGHVARALNQSSTFGAVLDMVTDRASTLCLLMLIASKAGNQNYVTLAMQAFGAIDLASHYAQMYAGVAIGSHSHKAGKALQEAPWMLRLYYGNKAVLFALCAGEQLFLLSCFYKLNLFKILVFKQYDAVDILLLSSMPLFALKQLMNFLQFINASRILATLDVVKAK